MLFKINAEVLKCCRKFFSLTSQYSLGDNYFFLKKSKNIVTITQLKHKIYSIVYKLTFMVFAPLLIEQFSYSCFFYI